MPKPIPISSRCKNQGILYFSQYSPIQESLETPRTGDWYFSADDTFEIQKNEYNDSSSLAATADNAGFQSHEKPDLEF